jgi:hypothetical protein
MADMVYGYNWTNIGTIGTTVVSNTNTNLIRILIPGTYVGTVVFQDAASATGTTATSRIYTVPIPAVSIPQSIEVGARCKNGLVFEATGTPTLTIIWG